MGKIMLEGLKVIEMATYVAAPAAGAMLRDWGADVTKVEPLNGCPMRRFFEGMRSNVPIEGNPIFTLDNRGKKGVSINTSDEKGAKLVSEMIKNADVFLTNVSLVIMIRTFISNNHSCLRYRQKSMLLS